jgi:stage II sporulation protein D (peptidoglycan lytic transglycosylase)
MIRVGIGPGSTTVRSIPLEEYVAGVLTGEAAPNSDPAVLQALAVAVRTYALKHLGRHEAEGFDVCDQTHCQVLRVGTEATVAAAAATVGEVLTWRGAVADVYYSASCGGHTELPSAVWPGTEDPPYLPARPDDACGGEPAWSAAIPVRDLQRALRAAGFRGTLRRARIASRDRSGRVERLAVEGLTPSVLSGQDLRMAVGPILGWQLVKSAAFDLRRVDDSYEFTGHGYGHGVGMCVIGATRLAERGEPAEALLSRYFPGTVIGWAGGQAPPVPRPPPSAAPPVTTAARAAAVPVVPDETARLRQELDALSARVRIELAATLQVSSPSPVPIRLHATDAEYERATGRHWFTFAAFVGGEIHLMPVDQLRQRGILERVLRRETVHALVDADLAQRPRWVRDGASLYFSEPQARAGVEVRGPCPADLELEEPVSAGALANAYARARACVAKQIGGGRSWRDVR